MAYYINVSGNLGNQAFPEIPRQLRKFEFNNIQKQK